MACALIVTLGACSEHSGIDNSWQAYQTELSELADTPIQPMRPSPMPIMPRSGDLRIEIDRLSIGLLDSLRLDRCRLGQMVAQRNSALGQARSASAMLRYELDSMQAIEECLTHEAVSEPRIIAMLEKALEHKQETLPLYIDQVLTRSQAFRTSMRAASRPHGLNNDADFAATLAALNYVTQTFNAALAGAYTQIDLEPYNSHMQTLSRSDFLPRHWRSMQNNAAWLGVLNPVLAQLAEQIDCDAEEAVANAQKVSTLRQDYYVAEIEPLLLRWNLYHAELNPALQQLMGMSLQGEWRAYMDELIGDGSHADQVSEMTATHTALWQLTLQQCQLPTE